MQVKTKYSRNFKLSIAGEKINNISSSMMLVLFPWIVLTLTNSPFLAGVELSISNVPLAFSFLVGHYLTKVKSKKALEVGVTGIRALVLLFIFLVFLTGNEFYELVSIFIGFFITSWTEDVSSQIGGYWDKEFLDENQYQRGFSLSTTLSTIINLISYILAGTFIAIGIDLAFPILIMGFAIATVIRSFIKPKSDGFIEDQPHNFKEGFSYIWKNNVLRYLMLQALSTSLAVGGFLILIESLVKYRYGSSPFILTGILVGAMVGGVVGASLSGRIKGNPRTIMGIAVFFYIPLILFIPFSPSYIFIIVDGFVITVLNQIHGVTFNNIFFKSVTKDHMLQVRGAHSSLALFPAVISSLIIGSIIEFVSIDSAFYFIAALTLVTLYFTWKAKEIGKMRID